MVGYSEILRVRKRRGGGTGELCICLEYIKPMEKLGKSDKSIKINDFHVGERKVTARIVFFAGRF